MIHFDLEQFVDTGILGPFSTQSSRNEIVQLLGEPEPETYPGVAHYGHIAFDLAGGEGPPCLIQVGIPHPTHMRPADPKWENWTAPICFDNWPDERFEWQLGRLTPGLSVDEAVVKFAEFEEAVMISACNGFRILHNPKSLVQLSFENDENIGKSTITSIAAFPNANAA